LERYAQTLKAKAEAKAKANAEVKAEVKAEAEKAEGQKGGKWKAENRPTH
jgi:hypothetical protein